MRYWSLRQVRVSLFAVCVIMGMSLSTVHASNMAAERAITADIDVSEYDGYQGCSHGGGDYGMKSVACAALCATPVLAVFPQEAPVLSVQRPASFAALYPLLLGRASPPDPYPPRPSHID